jgi:single-stranded-DNA-specific exonuclease
MFCADKSVRGREWVLKPVPDELPRVSGLSGEVLEVIVRRGIQDIEQFLRPTFRNAMPDPFVLKSMDAAVARFCDAIQSGERICLFGDYDVDGATSTSIVIRFMRMIGCQDPSFVIPQRLSGDKRVQGVEDMPSHLSHVLPEGYGPTPEAMRAIRADGHDLVVVVDSGTVAFEALGAARAAGLDAIVLDHHQAKEELPPAIVVNPKRLDEDQSLAYLCTAGLAFLFVVGVNRELRARGWFADRAEPDLRSLLGLVALGTVCDVVPLVGLNRSYVRLGLSHMDRIPGLLALREAKAIEEHTVQTCGFLIGPCINAGGRISDTLLGTMLLTEDDVDRAREVAGRLIELNRERQAIQETMLAEAQTMVDEKGLGSGSAIVLASEAWHPGVIGLVASRFKEKHDCVVAVVGEGGKGSARGVEGFDLGKAVMEAVDNGLLTKGGGHAMAAGFTVAPGKVDAFRDFLAERAGSAVRPPLHPDLVVPCGSIDLDLVRAMKVCAPYGMGNPEPRFAIVGGYVHRVRLIKNLHVKAWVIGPEGESEVIAFNAVNTPLGDAIMTAKGRFADFYGKAKIDQYGGEKVSFMPEDVMVGPPATEDEIAA